VINKYSDPDYETLFPSISNQKYNQNLKKIATIVGIRDKLTTYVARHTFASIFLNSGGHMETLRKILSHSDVNTTQVYARMFDQTVVDEIDIFDK
jgi:site-specific recombinase XerD